MKFYRSFAFATVSILALSTPAFAGDVTAADPAKPAASDA
jgi:hypothetical protein